MAIKTHDTNPNISSTLIREILTMESEVDKHLIDNLKNGKTSYLLSASGKESVEELIKRYRKVGWTVTLAYSGDNLFRLEFEDPEQLEVTKKISALKLKLGQ